MAKLLNIASKIVGAGGLGLAGYDAYRFTKDYSSAYHSTNYPKYLENIARKNAYLENGSYINQAIRDKTTDLMMRNPIPSLWTKTKGGLNGFFTSLRKNFALVAGSFFALGFKGFMSKIGAGVVVADLLYRVAREGFGIGKGTKNLPEYY